MEKSYIWQNKSWPHFFWNLPSLIVPLSELCKKQGLLEGLLKAMGDSIENANNKKFFNDEIINSYKMSNIDLSDFDVMSHINKKLNLEALSFQNKKVAKNLTFAENIGYITFDAVLNSNEPLSLQRLLNWNKQFYSGKNSEIDKKDLGFLRTKDFSYKVNDEIIYEAPPAKNIQEEVEKFIQWFNTPNSNLNLNNIIKSAISHLFFIAIYPFKIGSDFMARQIGQMALCHKDYYDTLFHDNSEIQIENPYSISSQLLKEKKEYYTMLKETLSGSMDITRWLLWYIESADRAVDSVIKALNNIQNKKDYMESISNLSINKRQQQVISMILNGFEEKITSTKYAEICDCSQDTGARDLENLLELGIMEKGDTGGRSTFYFLKNN